MKKDNKNYEKLSYHEHKETNLVLWINTIFTILTGIGVIILSVLEYLKDK